jgi:hypothetical protein
MLLLITHEEGALEQLVGLSAIKIIVFSDLLSGRNFHRQVVKKIGTDSASCKLL